MSDTNLDHANRVTWARLNTEDYYRTVAQYSRKENLMITKLVSGNEAIELLMEHGMGEDGAEEALDWADENGEYVCKYRGVRYSVTCKGGKTAGTIAYQVTIR